MATEIFNILYEHINTISIILFYSVIALFFIKNRKKIETQYKIFFLYRTKKGINLMRKIATKFKSFWKAYGYIGVPVGFIGMVFILGFLTWKLIEIFISPIAMSSIALVVPGIKIPGSPIFIPFWYGIISIIIVLIVHEGSHGVVAEAHGLKLKSAGVGMFAIIPLAFVEPDEKKLKRAPRKVQLSVLSAGPFANLLTAGIVMLLFSFVLAPAVGNTFDARGLEVTEVGADWYCTVFGSNCANEYPVEKAGLQKGDVIVGFNGRRINSTLDFSEELAEISPNKKTSLELEDGRILAFTTAEHPKNASNAYLGLSVKQHIFVKEAVQAKYGSLPWSLFYLSQLFYWLFALSVGIGLINLLPLGIVDGGRMVSVALSKFKNKKLASKLFLFITVFSLFVLIFNLIGPYFKGAVI